MLLLVVWSLLAQSREVTIPFGKVRGSAGSGYEYFFGLPYAEPPLGNLRYAPPVVWSKPYPGGVLDATKFKGSCNLYDEPPLGNPSEDCLYLNVYAPLNATKLPVMIWIHGGSLLTGRSDDYNASMLAKEQRVVVVTLNYRMGSMGFLPFRELQAEKISTGNAGLLDQRAAMRWVKDNIAYFGGDPSLMTIFGESAGAFSTLAHYLLPSSWPYFQRAIMQSGGISSTPLDKVITDWHDLFTHLGCPTGNGSLACMRKKTTSEIVKAQGGAASKGGGWNPVIDGVEIMEDLNAVIQKGPTAAVPLMLGSNTNEGTMFVYPDYPLPLGEVLYRAWVHKTLAIKKVPDQFFTEVFEIYPPARDSRPVASDLLGDLFIVCASRRAAKAVSRAVKNTFLYHFAHKPCTSVPDYYGIYHSAEIPFVFHTTTSPARVLPPCTFNAEGDAFAQTIGDLWGNFARTGDPNSDANIWPRYTAGSDVNVKLAPQLTREFGRRSIQCNLWDRFNDFPPA